MLPYRANLKSNARVLRKTMTDAELLLWSRLKGKQFFGLQFYRQKPLGPYIVDFYCASKNLVIELDGGQHYEKANVVQDTERDSFFKDHLHLTVMRFTNTEVLRDLTHVLEKIMQECGIG